MLEGEFEAINNKENAANLIETHTIGDKMALFGFLEQENTNSKLRYLKTQKN
jgi:hypothetical protein